MSSQSNKSTFNVRSLPKLYQPGPSTPVVEKRSAIKSWTCCDCARANKIRDRAKRKFVDKRIASLPVSSEGQNISDGQKCEGSNCEHSRCGDCFDLDSTGYVISRCSGKEVDEDEYLLWREYLSTARMTWDGK